MEKTKCEVVALGWPQSLWFCLLVSQVLWPVLKWSRNSKSFCWVNQPRTLQVLDLATLTFTIPNSGTRKYRYCCMIKLHRRKFFCFRWNVMWPQKSFFIFSFLCLGRLTIHHWTKALHLWVAHPLPASTPCRHQWKTRTTSPWEKQVGQLFQSHTVSQMETRTDVFLCTEIPIWEINTI